MTTEDSQTHLATADGHRAIDTDDEHEENQVEALNVDTALNAPPDRLEGAGTADNGHAQVEGSVEPPTQAAEPETNSKETSTPKKKLLAVATPGKANGGPPTPLVKKIINSGTFGSGAVKAPTSKPAAATTASAKPLLAPALKKTASAASTTVKPVMATRNPALPTVTPSRRASAIPAKPSAPATARSALSSSLSGRPSASSVPARNASPTGSVSSLNSSATRPRAPISDSVKKSAPPRSSTLAPSALKPPTTNARATPASRSSAAPPPIKRSTNSISSIQEIDNKAVDQLKEKTEAISDLERRQEELQLSLKDALASVSKKELTILELEKAKLDVETKLKEAKDSLERLHDEGLDGQSLVQELKKELDGTKEAALNSNELIQTLQAQLRTLEDEVASSKANLQTLQTTQDASSSDAAIAATIEHEALLKAQTDLKAIATEIEALKKSHQLALEESQEKVEVLENKLAEAESLRTQLDAAKFEKEDNATKLSELEIEILELKEAQDSLEDERSRLQNRVKALEEEGSKTSVTIDKLAEDAKVKEAEHSTLMEKLTKEHDERLRIAADRHSTVVATLDALKSELDIAVAAHEQTKTQAAAAAEAEVVRLKEIEDGYLSKQAELHTEIHRITVDLEDQEAQYQSKVDAVKAEHSELLQEAFERAKNEAGDAHGQELQSLRAASNSTIEQIQIANQIALQALKEEHAAALESEVNSLTKQISNINLELKATQDDLAKSKASLGAALAEVKTLTKQRDEAQATANAAPTTSPEHAAEVTRLTQELSNANDDLTAVTDMLNLTKASMNQLSENHSRNMEEAAKVRADEVTKLRAVHDEEMTTLARQKSELLVKLSDLEGEVSTLKVKLEVQATAPKSNGSSSNGGGAPSSPGVPREELQRLHEAHNLRVYDMQAEHERIVRDLREELETSRVNVGELQQEVTRKVMEIQYLEQDQDESQEQITRLKAENETLKQQGDRGVIQP